MNKTIIIIIIIIIIFFFFSIIIIIIIIQHIVTLPKYGHALNTRRSLSTDILRCM